jgi:hypothetical protein
MRSTSAGTVRIMITISPFRGHRLPFLHCSSSDNRSCFSHALCSGSAVVEVLRSAATTKREAEAAKEANSTKRDAEAAKKAKRNDEALNMIKRSTTMRFPTVGFFRP